MDIKNQSKSKKCPSCQNEISFETTKCPYCGKDFKSWFKRHPILTVIIGFFIFSNIIGGLSSIFYSKKTSSLKDSTAQVKQPAIVEKVIDKTSLEYKIRHKKASEGKHFIINGVEIRIGEAADSVFQKLPESLGVKKTQDGKYGLVIEHNYGKYSILFARNVPIGEEGGSWYIVYDIYPSDYTP